MKCQCWKCFRELRSTREEFCPACGVVWPYDGKQRVERLRGKARRGKRWAACLRVLAGFVILVALLSVPFGLMLVRDGRDSYRNREERELTTWTGCVTIILAFGGFYMAAGIAGSAERRSRRLKDSYNKAEADLEKIHPAFLNENILLRPASAPSFDTLLRPAEGTTESDPNHLVRAVDSGDADEQ